MIDSRSKQSVVHLTLRQSKTDVFEAGVTIHLGRTEDIFCLVAALLAYLAIWPPPPGPLFLLQSGNLVSHQVLITAVRNALSSAGLDGTLFNGHSFRIGAATSTTLDRVPESTIKLMGRWRSSAFTRYLCPPVQSMAALSSRLI